MTKTEIAFDAIKNAFPAEPLPGSVVRAGVGPTPGGIDDLIAKTFGRRPWPELTLMDWLMLGTAPMVARGFFDPAAFRYYLPSLLCGALGDPAYLREALEAIVPDNQSHAPRGAWWAGFTAEVAPEQRKALAAFVAVVADTASWSPHTGGQDSELEAADAIWSARRRKVRDSK